MQERSRQKRYSPKVRTGCTVCKIRRVKCGEEKPACVNCQRNGRSCTYHPQPVKAVDVDMQHYSNIAAPTPVSCRYGNSEEIRCLEFYLHRTSPMVSFAGPAKDYWTILVPQASWKYAEIKYMLVALSLLDQYLAGDTTTLQVENQYRRAIEHYNMAVSSLSLKLPALPCIIVFSIMAHSFENITKGSTPTSIHTEAADKIISEYIKMQSCTSGMEAILINQVNESVGREPLLYGLEINPIRESSFSFQSLQQAREQLRNIVASVSHNAMISATELRIAKGSLNGWRSDYEQYRYSGLEPLSEKRILYLASNIVGSYLQLCDTQNSDPASQRLQHHLLKDAEYLAEYENTTELKWILEYLLNEIIRKNSHNVDLKGRTLKLMVKLDIVR